MPLPPDRDREPDPLRPQRDAVTRHYDARATTYDDGPLHRALADTIAGLVTEILAAAVGPPTRPRVLLDVGTGTGLVLRALTVASAPPQHAPSRPRIVGIGVDLSPAMLRIAAAESTGAAAYLRADATSMRRRHDAYATPAQLAAALAPHGLHLDDHRTRTWTDGEHHLLLCQATPSPRQGPRTGPVPAPPPPNQ